MKLDSLKIVISLGRWQWLIVSSLFFYICFALFIFFRADSMIFIPRPTRYQDTDEVLKVPVTPQEKISALYLPNPNAAYTVLYIHGNAEDLGDVRPRLEQLQRYGFSVFAYDYRGYGTSDGQPSEQNAYQDAKAAYTYLTQSLGVQPNRLLVLGRSLGGGSAVYLATQRPIAGIILESTFTSPFRVIVPFPIVPFDKFTNLLRLKQVNVPVLVIHGEQDQVVPIQHGRQLFAAASDPKMSLWVDRAGHSDISQVAGDQYFQTLTQFQTLLKD